MLPSFPEELEGPASLKFNRPLDAVRNVLSRPEVSFPLVLFLLMRFVLSAWMWGVRQIFAQPITPHPVLRPYLGIAVETNPWWEPWQRWDAIHYQAIAERGYQAFDTALFVPPLFPLLVRWTAGLFGGSTLIAGVIVSNLAFFGALVAIYSLAKYEGKSTSSARRTVLYLVLFPSAFFFFAGYTESLFLMTSALSIYAARQQKWGQAGLWGGLAALTRLPGLLMILPLTFAAWQAWRKTGSIRPWSAVVLTSLGSLIFPLYIWIFLHLPPWAPFLIQSERSHAVLTLPGVNIVTTLERILTGRFLTADLLDLVFILLFLICAVPAWKRLPRIYAVYFLSFLFFYLIRMSEGQPLLGTARYVLALFPAFFIFADWGQNRINNRIFIYLSWIGLLLMSGQFAIWGWVG